MDKVCWYCGSSKTYWESTETEYNADELFESGRRRHCKRCYEKNEETYQRDLKEYLFLKTKLMVGRAANILERQGADMYEYKDAIQAVSEFAMECPEKFMSAHEVVAAIILCDNEIEMHMQYKVGRYQVDFYLPTLKVILEIDGFLHDYHKQRDSNRDIKVKGILGREWETVRVPTKYIESNAEMLVEAIKTIRKEKQAGKLPTAAFVRRKAEH